MIFSVDTQALKLAKAQIESVHKGERIIIDPTKHDVSVPRLELSLPSLNKILSNKYYGTGSGFAMGRIYSFLGPKSIGKSALAHYIAGQVIAKGGVVLWIDKEASFDPVYALMFGIDVYDTEHFILAKPDNAEQAFDTIVSYVSNRAINLAITDSVPALGTMSQNDKDAEKASMAELSRKLAEHFPKVIGKIDKYNISLIYINQLRANISGGMAYGNKGTGGNAMEFYPHVELTFRQSEKLEKGTGFTAEYLGQDVIIKATKNKTSMPQKYAIFSLYPGEGFSREMDILNLAIDAGIVKKAGAWFSFVDGETTWKAQGQDKARESLKANPDMLNLIWDKTKVLLDPMVDIATGEIIEAEADEAA